MFSADLLLAAVAVLSIGVCFYFLGQTVARRSGRHCSVVLGFGLLFSGAFAWLAAERLFWAGIIPLSSVILWSHWTPVLVAGAAGIAIGNNALSAARRRLISSSLVIVGLLLFVHPVARGIACPITEWETTHWQGEDCLQSHPGTCGPASATTLLRHARIPASEQQLAHWCLSSNNGTSPLGLYRGLMCATAGTNLRPRVASTSLTEIAQRKQLPAVALIEFERPSQTLLPASLFGSGDQRHAVVILGRDTRGNWRISDPAVGRVVWDDATLRKRFSGQAIYLER